MHVIAAHKWLVLSLVFVVVLGFMLWQLLYIQYNGTSVPAPRIPRTTEVCGSSGPIVRYAVLGDSTSIGQGAPYEQAIARQTARKLAQTHRVELTNYGVSGARVADVLRTQVTTAAASKPDLVLIAVGANDVTHYTALDSVEHGMTAIIGQLQAANPRVKIVLTGSPAMGSVARFAPPTKWFMGKRVQQVNAVMRQVAYAQHVTLVPLAEKTGPTFNRKPTLFAQDKFHPNAAGYAVWLPVIEQGIAESGI